MKLHADHPFRRHAENLAAVKKGLVQVERRHRDAIRWNRLAEIETVSRLHALVIGMLAEAKLRAITWDPDGFNDRERDGVVVTCRGGVGGASRVVVFNWWQWQPLREFPPSYKR